MTTVMLSTLIQYLQAAAEQVQDVPVVVQLDEGFCPIGSVGMFGNLDTQAPLAIVMQVDDQEVVSRTQNGGSQVNLSKEHLNTSERILFSTGLSAEDARKVLNSLHGMGVTLITPDDRSWLTNELNIKGVVQAQNAELRELVQRMRGESPS